MPAMNHLSDEPPEAIALSDYDSQLSRLQYIQNMAWPMPLDQPQQRLSSQHHHHNTHSLSHSHHDSDYRAAMGAPSQSPPDAARFPFQQQQPSHQHNHPHSMSHQQQHQQQPPPPSSSRSIMSSNWPYAMPTQHQHRQFPDESSMDHPQHYADAYHSLQASPISFVAQQAQTQNPMGHGNDLAMVTSAESAMIPFSTPMEQFNPLAYYQNDLHNGLAGFPVSHQMHSGPFAGANLLGTSPNDNMLPDSSSSSESGWVNVDYNNSRQSFDLTDVPNPSVVNNPSLTLHIRSSSDSSNSDNPLSADARSLGSSFEEVQFAMSSPHGESAVEFVTPHDHSYNTSRQPSELDSTSPIPTNSNPSTSSSPSVSPSIMLDGSPSTRSLIRKSPPIKTSKQSAKKPVATTKKESDAIEKRVGKRKGPLRPEQRRSAGEIRKLRACLRCKFLKKTCDKGDPCAGCQPSHARLWQVPCTRIDIKDIGYFMKDWKADYERHVTLGFSIANIKGYSAVERPLWVTHGYGFVLPIQAREVFVRDENCFNVDWIETCHDKPMSFAIPTAKLSAGMEGVDIAMLAEYLDRHIDGGFERFVDYHFEGTAFLTEMLKTVYRYYQRTKLPIIRKALKLVLAYNLTMHVTMIEGLSEEEEITGKIEDERSRHFGKTVAPVMINFQIKCALADMWRELQKEILEELSALYSSVYSGDKLKNWPTIFMLASILLAVWEEMQFDAHYRSPDPAVVAKFCNDMESTPVGVIVGLFSAISQKLPSFTEWDTRKHHHILNSNMAVCDAMTEVREHVLKHENYLKQRSDCKFDRSDFDSLSNKFLSKLVIRAS